MGEICEGEVGVVSFFEGAKSKIQVLGFNGMFVRVGLTLEIKKAKMLESAPSAA